MEKKNNKSVKKTGTQAEVAADEYVRNESKVAVIVGASSGIGYHTALQLAGENYTVYNVSRTKAKLKAVKSVCADACKPGTIATALRSIAETEGRIDCFVYSAGWSLACPLEHTTESDYRKLFEINYFGLLESLRTVIPIMRQAGEGRIVAVSSMAGSTPLPFDAPYSASKAAVDMTMRSLAIELHPYNIKVSSVQPGGVSTHFTFKRKVYPSEKVGDYSDAMQKAVQKVDSAEQNGQDPRAVAAEIISVLAAKNPPQTVPIGLKNKATRVIEKLLPSALTDYMNRSAWE